MPKIPHLLIFAIILTACAAPQTASPAASTTEAPPAQTQTRLPAATATGTPIPSSTPTETVTPEPSATPTATEVPVIVEGGVVMNGQLQTENGVIVGEVTEGENGEHTLIVEPTSIISPQGNEVPSNLTWPADQVRIVDGQVEMITTGRMADEIIVYRYNPGSQELTQYFHQYEFENQWVDEDGEPSVGMTPFESIRGFTYSSSDISSLHRIAGNVAAITREWGPNSGDYIVDLAVPVDQEGNYHVIVPVRFPWGTRTRIGFFEDGVLLSDKSLFWHASSEVRNKEFFPELPVGTPFAAEIWSVNDPVAALRNRIDQDVEAGRSSQAAILQELNDYAVEHGNSDGCNDIASCAPYDQMRRREIGQITLADIEALIEYSIAGGEHPLPSIPLQPMDAAAMMEMPDSK